jgi:acyl-homoserine-lactone acylase
MMGAKVRQLTKTSIFLLAASILVILSAQAIQSTSEEIYKAAAEGDLVKVKELVERDPELVKAKNEDNETPLHGAAAAGHPKIVEYLLVKGADIDARNVDNQNPLLHAAYSGKAQVLQLLLDKGADFEQPDRYGRTVLHYPVRNGHKDVVEILVKKGMDITIQDGMGVSPLRFAIEGGHAGIVELFLANEALDISSRPGVAALHLAAKQGQKEIVDLLIAEGASTQTKDDMDATLLHNTAIGNLTELSTRLITEGAALNDLDKRGRTPLHYAVKQGSLEITKLLVQKGADLNIIGKDNRTALHIAEDWDFDKIIELLISEGAAKGPRLTPKNPDKPWVAVTYISNDGFMIDSKTKKVVVDALIKNPWGYSNTPDKVFDDMVDARQPFDRIDLLLFSHAHRDHFEPEMAVKVLMSHPETIMVGNEIVYNELKEAAGDSFPKISARVMNINPEWGTIIEESINGVNLKIFPVNHAMPEQPYMTLAYLLDMDGTVVLHMGDIYAPSNEEYFKVFQLQKLGIDLAFIDPFFLLDDVGQQMAKEFIQPKQIVPMHMREYEIEKYVDFLGHHYNNISAFRECLEKKLFQDQSPFPEAGKVRIVRDSFGLPHIFAANEPDAMYGLGYATAEDRLNQIFTTLFTAAGRSTELAGGANNLQSDILFRSFRFKKRAEEIFNDMKPELRKLAVQYCRGISDFIEEHREKIPAWITDFEPSDMISIAFLMNAKESFNDLQGDVWRGQRGSNHFAVSPSRSASGYALLSMDSHEPFSGPTAWYEAQISTPEFSVVGAVIPGLPIITMGHNGKIAWHTTNNDPDLADVYKFKINPDNANEYLSHDGWKTFSEWEETFRIKTKDGFQEQKKTIRKTHVGPVLQVQDGYAYAVRFIEFDSPTFFEQAYKRTKATSVNGYLEIMRMPGMSMWNHTIADSEGNIGYLYNALCPRRNPELDWSKPVAGEDPRSEWMGYIPFDDLPKLINPESGWIQNSNDSPGFVTENSGIEEDSLPVRLVEYKRFGDRGKRLSELLKNDDSVTFEELFSFATDTLVWKARLWVPLILDAHKRFGKEISSSGGSLDEAVNLLRTWDFRCEADSNAMALFQLSYLRARLDRMNPAREFKEDDLKTLLKHVDEAAAELKNSFGRMDIPWGKIHYLSHGGIEYPIGGGSSSLSTPRACFTRVVDGRLQVVGGSSYHMVVEMSPHPKALSCFPLGASEDPKSPHYSDITAIYARKEYKPVWFVWEDLSRHIESDMTLDVPAIHPAQNRQDSR